MTPGTVPTLWVQFEETWVGPARLSPAYVVYDYQPPSLAYPNGSVLISGRGECSLWFDRSQLVVKP